LNRPITTVNLFIFSSLLFLIVGYSLIVRGSLISKSKGKIGQNVYFIIFSQNVWVAFEIL